MWHYFVDVMYNCMCRADKCKEALSQSQGLMLFGSKIKLTQMDLEGECTAIVMIQ